MPATVSRPQNFKRCLIFWSAKGTDSATSVGYGVGNKDFYEGIWKKKPGPAWVTRNGLTSEVFQSEIDKYVAHGYILKILDGYTMAGKDRYAALCECV